MLRAVGYESIFKSENVAQYVSPVKIMGEIDFLLAFRGPSLKMLEKAISIDIFDGRYKIKVVRPEDIIGLKLQALVNDPERLAKEYADIEALMKQYDKQLDWPVIEEYFGIFNKQDKFSELKRKYHADEKEKQEWRELAQSDTLREDMRRLEKNRHNPFIVNGRVDLDKYIRFLTEFNAFANHARRPFHRIIDKDMRL